MKIQLIAKTLFVLIITLTIASCDRDFNEIGTGFVGNDHFGLSNYTSEVIAYNQTTGAVQTNNLPVNTFGFYNNPAFGKTTASFFTQIGLTTNNPTFININTITIDSVYAYVPYYSTFLNTDTDTGDSTFELDSIYGTNKIKLSLHRSNFIYQEFDPSSGLQQPMKYYSDQQTLVEPDNTDLLFEKDDFEVSPQQIKLLKNAGTPEEAVKERLAPGMFLDLTENNATKKAYFKQLLVNGINSNSFANNNTFRNYFKGLFFKAQPATSSPNDGTLVQMNFGQGKITIVYHDQTSSTDVTAVRKTLNFNLNGNTINFLNDNLNNPLINGNLITGDSNLVLKGGNGSMAVIDLFGGNTNATSTELNNMRNQNWLVNEATINFTINTPLIGTTSPEPNRILLYNLTDKKPIIDYYYDPTTNTKTSKYNKYIHDGIIKKTSSGRGTNYKIRVTEHLRSLINNADSTNVKLGLVVTENINNATSGYLKNPFTIGSKSYKFLPIMNVVNPLGTFIYGNNIPISSADYDKRVKLEIWYTKPD